MATNSGGPHTLKYGVTVNHIRGCRAGAARRLRRQHWRHCEDNPGYDLTGLIVGSEGTFGIVTKVIVNLTRDPEAGRTLLGVFDSVEAATETVSGIIAAGIVPAALEMLDNLMIQAVEQAFHFGFPTEAGAILIIEIDGIDAGMDREAQAISEIVQSHGGQVQKSITWRTRKEPEYVAIWKSRKSAFGAIGRLSPTFCTQDGVVPRTLLPHILRFIEDVSRRYDIRIANVFHAGDGNIHPILLFDERDPEQVKRVLHASHEILEECIRVGGSVTGEHGIGVEKMALMPKLFAPEDLAAMVAIRQSLNPEGRCSPSKMLPTGGHCIEQLQPGAPGLGMRKPVIHWRRLVRYDGSCGTWVRGTVPRVRGPAISAGSIPLGSRGDAEAWPSVIGTRGGGGFLPCSGPGEHKLPGPAKSAADHPLSEGRLAGSGGGPGRAGRGANSPGVLRSAAGPGDRS